MRNSLVFLLVSLAALVQVSGPLKDEAQTITVCGRLGTVAESALRSEGVLLQYDGALLRLEVRDKASALRGLARAYAGQALAKHTTEVNIANKDTVKGVDGMPFRRQSLRFDQSGSVSSVHRDDGDFNWVYDPRHPDAVQEGSHRGYVARPNINLELEKDVWSDYDRQQSAIKMVMARLDPDLIVSPAPAAIPAPSPAPFQTVDFGAPFPSVDDGPDILPEKPGSPFSSRWLSRQTNPVASGQASVACALNWLGKEARWNDAKVDQGYGFCLLNALNTESESLGIVWEDAGDLSPDVWPRIEARLKAGFPVIVALNGPLSPRTRGTSWCSRASKRIRSATRTPTPVEFSAPRESS